MSFNEMKYSLFNHNLALPFRSSSSGPQQNGRTAPGNTLIDRLFSFELSVNFGAQTIVPRCTLPLLVLLASGTRAVMTQQATAKFAHDTVDLERGLDLGPLRDCTVALGRNVHKGIPHYVSRVYRKQSFPVEDEIKVENDEPQHRLDRAVERSAVDEKFQRDGVVRTGSAPRGMSSGSTPSLSSRGTPPLRKSRLQAPPRPRRG
ncbi:hypothetical protein HYPSUDRAFT_209170 [Hypholoma sublateritium FD-334 SS-4]|uniref:Uncharacterized protein n=1 Tax=Hypholoma sublateritium (strain FD-334 SS-4) TaxID=945553 RepID=A0A0D2NBF3_HYPSF|nr:hypothetical protein HYPSUDRAFT_210084 [Hypholoma sublateritium FD-334 SS-4]KJA13891.1 hypothetical protein HYPSUDRAFT_209170 [Hypholoma sublateritium FD-334 SS-4]